MTKNASPSVRQRMFCHKYYDYSHDAKVSASSSSLERPGEQLMMEIKYPVDESLLQKAMIDSITIDIQKCSIQ